MLALTPPMGWNSWNTFGINIDENLIMEIADTFIEKGLKDAGYEYIVIDDCWADMKRDKNGKLCPDPVKFPHGIKYLSDYIHSKGLKFGIYSNAGTRTCKGHPASFDHEFEDAKTFAEWEIDYLKYDCCYIPSGIDWQLLYRRMGIALRECGRDIVYAACCNRPDVHEWSRGAGAHLYRTTTDILDNPVSVRDIALSQLDKLGASATGCFNDIDMLVVGMYNKGNVAFGGCTDNEYIMHFALWCMMGVPLMIGCDIRNTTPQMIHLLKNKKLIRINQDPECRPPLVIKGYIKEKVVLFRLLSNNEYALGVFNFTDGDDRDTNVDLFDMGLSFPSGYGLEAEDLFTGEKITSIRETFYVPAPSHSCKVYLVKIIKL